MALESKLSSLGRLGKSLFFAGALTLSGMLINGCNKTPTGSDKEEPKKNPPTAPYIADIYPTIEEPKRGIYIQIGDESDNEKGFYIYKKTSGGTFQKIKTLPQNPTSTFLTEDWSGIQTSTKYTYRVSAYNDAGESNYGESTVTSAGPVSNTISLSATADAYVSSGNPNGNIGKDGSLIVAKYDDGGSQEAYIKFDYTKIPSYTKTIDQAILQCVSKGSSVILHPEAWVEDLASDFNETTVTWNTKPIGRGNLVDYAYINNDGQLVSWDITPIIQNYKSGTTLNHGIRISANQNIVGIGYLYSREGGYPPNLTIHYTW